jgi:3-oxoacyl-[acyl-carrier protein] reductase
VTVAVLTGASRGIGRATALALARRSVDLALLSRPSAERDAVTEAVAQAGAQVVPIDCDLRDASSIGRAAERAVGVLGVPDAIVNDAGVIERASVVQTTPEQWDEQLDVNLRAPFLVTRALLPGMLSKGSGRIVNVGSISSTLGTANAAAYAASKWGLVGFTKSLAEELTDTGVSAVAVLPGSVATRMLEGSGFSPRMSVDDVAATIVHYALDAPIAHNGGIVEMFGI